jgi:hypothetical protein
MRPRNRNRGQQNSAKRPSFIESAPHHFSLHGGPLERVVSVTACGCQHQLRLEHNVGGPYWRGIQRQVTNALRSLQLLPDQLQRAITLQQLHGIVKVISHLVGMPGRLVR